MDNGIVRGCVNMSYEVNGVKYDEWSVNNQRVLDKLIDREIYCCMTSEVEYMLKKVYDCDDDNPFGEDDLSLTYKESCPECGSHYGFSEITLDELSDDDLQKVHGFLEDVEEDGDGFECPICGLVYSTSRKAKECCDFGDPIYKCDSCGKLYSQDEYQKLETEPAEVYEWWAVSRWFGEKLKEQGCVVIESWGKSYWGRETTGQSISLDGCILAIAKSMEILEGMQNYWGN